LQTIKNNDTETTLKLFDSFENYTQLQEKDPETGWTCLHFASFNKNLEVVRRLLHHGVNPNAQTYTKVTALMIAAEAGSVLICKALL
jgi:hypothetical protein